MLDNCEHLADACARLAEAVLRAGPGVRLLVTSREALGTAGEAPYPVPPLALPDPRRPPVVAALRAYEAVRLFVERAATARPGFALTARNAPAVARICAQLDGLPWPSNSPPPGPSSSPRRSWGGWRTASAS